MCIWFRVNLDIWVPLEQDDWHKYKSWHRINVVPIRFQYANTYGVKQDSPKSLNTRCCHNVESFATERSSRQIWETLSMYWTGSFPRINNWKTPQNTILMIQCYFVVLHYRQYYFYLCWCSNTQIKTHCPKPTVFSLKMHWFSVLFLLSSKSWLKQHFICTRIPKVFPD